MFVKRHFLKTYSHNNEYMARKVGKDKILLSAGEIGSYTVCPLAWKLKAIDRVRSQGAVNSKEGKLLHQEWAKGYEEILVLLHNSKIVLGLLILSVFLYLMR